MDGREIRLRRLMGEGRCVVIAMDHGLFDGPIPGMKDLRATARRVNPCVDAVLLAPGMVRHCAEAFAGAKRPLAIVRLNWNTVYCFKMDYRRARSVCSCQPEEAVAEGMDIALVSLTLRTGEEERDAANVEVFSRLTHACHRLGIPVIGEYFPTGGAEMTPKQLHDDVLVGSRVVAELGADAVKTFYTCDFAEVTASCPVGVLALGAEKLPTQREALLLAQKAMAGGAAGVVFGRNAIQVPDPAAFQAALCDVVRGGAAVGKAVRAHRLGERR